MKLVFATNNKNKIKEVREILGTSFEVLSLGDIGCYEDVPETSDTLDGNALQKARYVKEHYGYDCFADDTGLEVDALAGEPGVYSARYAATKKPGSALSHDSNANMQCLMEQLANNRSSTDCNSSQLPKARFRTVIALLTNAQEHLFEGIVNGAIANEKHGDEGFGYDPLFIPEEELSMAKADSTYTPRTFAEMTAEEKNSISHRARAVRKLVEFLTMTCNSEQP